MKITNSVALNAKGIIEIHVRGDQTAESVKDMGDQALCLGAEQRGAGQPALIMDNLLEIGTVPAEAKRLVVDLIKSTDYNRLAMVGAGPMIRFGANLMLQATGKGSRVRYFDDYEQAETWLLLAK